MREVTAAPNLDGWALVEWLLTDLVPLRERIWLVIDDVHELGPGALRQLELLVLRAPPELRFVLASRHDLRLGCTGCGSRGSWRRSVDYLPTNLTAPEIARELSVSRNTGKTHMRNVYAKLGPHRRAEAVARARELRLLAPSTRQWSSCPGSTSAVHLDDAAAEHATTPGPNRRPPSPKPHDGSAQSPRPGQELARGCTREREQ